VQRRRFEAEARTAIPGFRISQRGENGALVAATPRDEYSPVLFVEPNAGNEPALGFDLASEQVRREALHRARESGRIALSGPITLVQEKENQAALIAFLPIDRKGASMASEVQGRAYLEGFAVVVFRVGDLIEYAIARLASEGIDIWVQDTTVASTAELLHVYIDPESRGDRPRSPPADALHAKDGFELGGRRWQVIAAPAPGALALPVARSAWLALLAGLLMTAILGWYMRALQRYGSEMARANRALDREVAEHRQTGAALKNSNERFRQILDRFQ
jgi:CHASE1-domain containing sensor protein